MEPVAPGIIPPSLYHWFPVAWEEVRTTEPPEQRVVDPPAVMVGAAGPAVTETTNELELLEHQSLQEEDVVV